MTETLFNINILSKTLEKYDIDPNQSNCYLFLCFFLERCQLVSNIIRIINPDIKKSFSLGIKYCIVYEYDYDKIIKKVKEYKNDFEKNDLINELIKFIKNTIDDKKIELIKNDNSPNKITQLFNNFDSIKFLLDELDNYNIEENEIYEFLQSKCELDNNEFLRIKLENDLAILHILWEKNNKKSELCQILKNFC